MQPSLQSLVDLLPEPVLLVGRDGRVLLANRAFERAAGLGPGAAGGCALASLSATPAAELAGYLRRCSGTLQPLPGVLDLPGGTGPPLRFRTDGATTLGEDGRPGPVLLRLRAHGEAVAGFSLLGEQVRRLGEEVLLRKRAEEGLRRSEERLRLAVDAADMGTWDLDVGTGMIEASPRCRALLGLGADGPLDFGGFLGAVHRDDRGAVREAVEAALGAGRPESFAVEYRTGAGRWLSHRGRAIPPDGAGGARATGMVLDVTEERRAAEHQALLINELNHRVKNTLATVQSIAAQTRRAATGLDGFWEAFGARLMALSKTHDLLTRERWRGTGLAELVAAEASPYQDAAGSRVRAGGPVVRLAPKAAVSLGLALHELLTNAAKYGALSVPGGHVEVRWAPGPGGEGVRVVWEEAGGPPVRPPERRGFGSRLLERNLAYDLGARIALLFPPGGVRCELEIPRAALEGVSGDG